VYNTFTNFCSLHSATELPGVLKLQVQRIMFWFPKAKQQFFVKFKYGNKDHTTSLTTGATAGGQYTWFVLRLSIPQLLSLSLDRDHPETWLIETNKEHHEQSVSFEVFRRTSTAMFKKDKVCATGKIPVSPLPPPNFQCRPSIIHAQLLGSLNQQTHVELEGIGSTEAAALEIFLT